MALGPAVENIYTQLSIFESMVPFAGFWIRFFARIAMFFVDVFDVMEAQDLKERERRKEEKELKRREKELKRSGSSSEGGGSEDLNFDDE